MIGLENILLSKEYIRIIVIGGIITLLTPVQITDSDDVVDPSSHHSPELTLHYGNLGISIDYIFMN